MDVQRTVSPVEAEYVVRGSNDGFVESLDTNKKLIQAKIRNSYLILEDIHHSDIKKTTTTLVYLSNQIEHETLQLVRNRLLTLHSLFIFSSGHASVSAGLASNLMIIVIASTTLATFIYVFICLAIRDHIYQSAIPCHKCQQSTCMVNIYRDLPCTYSFIPFVH